MRRRRGFVLAELLVVMAICLILMAVAAPNLHNLLRAQQLKVALADLFDAIEATRWQAIARGERVQLAPIDSSGWEQGWVVFVDRDEDDLPSEHDEVIAAHGPLAEGIRVESAFSGKPGRTYIAYNAQGRGCTDASSLAARWGTVSLIHGEQTRRIKINMLGRARTCDPARDGASCTGVDHDP